MILLISIIVHPFTCHAQASTAARSVAVQPLLDGDADDESQEAASAISAALRISTPHHIIDSNVAAKVAEYQAPPAAASENLKAAGDALARAKEHCFAFRYKDAQAGLERAISLLKSMRAGPEVGQLLVDAYVTQAIVAKSMGNANLVRSSFDEALTLNPALSLSGSEYPPSLVALFEETRKEKGSAPSGSLMVKSRPPAAEVYLNGIQRGVTPIEITGLPAGDYSLVIRANKYDSKEKLVTVVPGKRIEFDEKLKWANAEANGVEKAKNGDAANALREGLRFADALKAERVIVINADSGAGKAVRVTARTVDRALRAGQRAVVIKSLDPAAKNEQLAEMVAALADQLDMDMLTDPAKKLDPLGEGDPILLGKRKEPLTRKPAFWVAVGTAAAGAIIGGILAAMSSSSGTGSLKVEFR